MGEIRHPPPVKLFVGILTSSGSLLPEVEEMLVRKFGPVDLRAGPYAFDATDYYNDEMGSPIDRYFLAFANLISPEALAQIKLKTNELEGLLAGRVPAVPRPINLDPGYLEQAKVILASTKNFYHRILLSNGIYAEVTLHFENGDWKAFPWTFPDFKSGRYNAFFTSLRRRYRSQLKGSA